MWLNWKKVISTIAYFSNWHSKTDTWIGWFQLNFDNGFFPFFNCGFDFIYSQKLRTFFSLVLNSFKFFCFVFCLNKMKSVAGFFFLQKLHSISTRSFPLRRLAMGIIGYAVTLIKLDYLFHANFILPCVAMWIRVVFCLFSFFRGL